VTTCVGDCDGDGAVAIDELLRGVSMALGTGEMGDCSSFDSNGDAQVSVDELVQAVTNILEGCSIP
jgi:Ca2+-binding EF-hand superfamily protein